MICFDDAALKKCHSFLFGTLWLLLEVTQIVNGAIALFCFVCLCERHFLFESSFVKNSAQSSVHLSPFSGHHHHLLVTREKDP